MLDVIGVKAFDKRILFITVMEEQLKLTLGVFAVVVQPVDDGFLFVFIPRSGSHAGVALCMGKVNPVAIEKRGELICQFGTGRVIVDDLGDGFRVGLDLAQFIRARLDGFVGVLVVVDIDKLAGLVVDDMEPEIIRLGKEHRVEDTLFVVGYGRGEGVGVGKAVAETVSGQGVDHVACQMAGKFVGFVLNGNGADGVGVHDVGTVVVDGDLEHGGDFLSWMGNGHKNSAAASSWTLFEG